MCRNCVKSKRECLGYDPGFRPQPAPSDIRPASNTPQPSLLVNPQENHNSNNNPYPSAPPGYIPASAQPFAPSVQSDSSIQSFDQSNNNRQGPAEPSVEESDTMSVMASVQDTIDGSMSQPVGTPDLSTPALMPLSGQVGRQGMLHGKGFASAPLTVTSNCRKSKNTRPLGASRYRAASTISYRSHSAGSLGPNTDCLPTYIRASH